MSVPEIKTLKTLKEMTFPTFVVKEGDFTCPVHGIVKNKYIEKSDGTIQWDTCPLCLQEKEKEEERKQQEKAMKAERERWVTYRIKPKFFDLWFDNFNAYNDSLKKALSLVQDIAFSKSNRSLLLLGSNGLGKTMLSSIALKFRGGAIYKMYEIVMRIKASYKNSSEESEQDILTELSKLPLLVIDEVGRQFGSDSEKNWMSYVLDERYEDGLPTILISNLKLSRDCTKEEQAQGLYIEHYLGKDSVSRLVECADIVTVTGEDWRRKNRT